MGLLPSPSLLLSSLFPYHILFFLPSLSTHSASSNTQAQRGENAVASLRGLRVDISAIHHHPVEFVLWWRCTPSRKKKKTFRNERTKLNLEKKNMKKRVGSKEEYFRKWVCKSTEHSGSCWEFGLLMVEEKMQDKLLCNEQRLKHSFIPFKKNFSA